MKQDREPQHIHGSYSHYSYPCTGPGPEKTENSAEQNLYVARKINKDATPAQGYNLAYFNLWWSRMAVEGRKDDKEMITKEEEARRLCGRMMFTTRKDKTQIKSIEVGHPVSRSQSKVSENNLPWRGGEISAMGDNCDEWGVGWLVPGDDDFVINEQSQDPVQVVKQVVNGTRVPFVGVVPGFEDATGGMGGVRERESGGNLRR
jgi:hypothetical protein